MSSSSLKWVLESSKRPKNTKLHRNNLHIEREPSSSVGDSEGGLVSRNTVSEKVCHVSTGTQPQRNMNLFPEYTLYIHLSVCISARLYSLLSLHLSLLLYVCDMGQIFVLTESDMYAKYRDIPMHVKHF